MRIKHHSMVGLSTAGVLLTAVVVLISAGACGGGSPANPSPTPTATPTGRGTMTAIVDGVAYTSGSITGARVTATGELTVQSLNVGNTAQLGFVGAARLGTATIAPSSATTFTYTTVNAGAVTAIWTASGSAGNGTLTVTTLTATGASGTFTFSAPPLSGSATGTKLVTNGTFNATF